MLSIGVLALSVTFLAQSPAEENSLSTEIRDTCDLLRSPFPRAIQAGEERLARDGGIFIDHLVRELAVQDDSAPSLEAAEQLSLLLSPWLRAEGRNVRSMGQMALGKPRRPTGRPVDHPRAAEIREALIGALWHWLVDPPDAKPWFRQDAVKGICVVLAEVGDRSTASALVGLLSMTDDSTLGRHLIRSFDAIYGLPSHFPDMGMCGNSTAAERKRFNEMLENRYRSAREQVFAWNEAKKLSTDDEVMTAAIEAWDRAFKDLAYEVSSASPFMAWPLVRFGEPIVPLLERRIAQSKVLEEKARFETARAAITGTEEASIVRALLSAPSGRTELALGIIRAADSRAWLSDLDRLQRCHGEYFASEVLAVCHLEEALPFLSSEVERNPENHKARYAALGIQEWIGLGWASPPTAPRER